MQLKKCSICGVEKHLSEFNKHSRCKFGVRPQCKQCHSKQSIKWQQDNKEHRKEFLKNWYSENLEKVKEQRENYKQIKNKRRRDRYSNDDNYKNERLVQSKKWQENNPDKRKNQRLKQYGITFDDFKNLLVKANNKCEICGFEDFSDKKKFPVLDHCHTTNKVRGILCHKCNFALGHFDDSIQNLQNAIKYLKIKG